VKKLFNEALMKIPSHEFPDTYKLNQKLMESVTLDLFMKICIGLFEAHKIVYSFLICTGIKRQEKKIKEDFWNLLLRGAPLNMVYPNKPEMLFVSESQWQLICALQKIANEKSNLSSSSRRRFDGSS
jgi:dynein heavy chain